MEQIEDLIKKSNKKYEKIDGIFKTKYLIENNITIDVCKNHFTVTENREFYTASINKESLTFLKNLLENER